MKKHLLAFFSALILFPCAAFGCDSDADCAFDEECVVDKHRCVVLSCPDERPAEDHACSCPAGTIRDDKECVKPVCLTDADCPKNFFCLGAGSVSAECAGLSCLRTEKIVKHACVKMTCAEIDKRFKPDCDELEIKIDMSVKGADGRCGICRNIPKFCDTDSECPESEICLNGSCMPLSCHACQKIKDHACVQVPDCCRTDGDCQENEKCSASVCVKKTCMELNPYFRNRCSWTEKAEDLNIVAANGKCFRCEQKTCRELNPLYRKTCGYQEVKVETAMSGADGDCFFCRKKTCRQLDKNYRRKCGKYETALETGASGSDGKCYICTRKSCSQINEHYTTVCGKYDLMQDTGVSGSDGRCYTCARKTCAQIDPSYTSYCPPSKKAEAVNIAAADGSCFICR